MLKLNLNDSAIQRLKKERFNYPCPHVQKRIQAVYFKAAFGLSNEMIGKFTSLHPHVVSDWIHAYQSGGFDALCEFNYGTNKSELEHHSTNILNPKSSIDPKTLMTVIRTL